MASVIRGSGASTLGGALDVQGVLTYEDVTSVDSIGIITARSGINVGTGASISSPDTNELALGTNNVERLRIASGGDVNIGPSANANGHGLLTLSQSASAAFNALVIQQGNTAFTATDGLQIGIDAGVNAYFKLYENRDFYFTTGTSNTEKLRITSTGQLQATGAADVRLTLGSGGTAGTNDSVHMRADGANLLFMNASGGLTKFESNGTETLRVSSDGEVTKPLQPRFHARLLTDQTSYDGRNVGGTWIIYNTTDYDIGNNFVTSGSDQGRFVAPVSGLYLFQAAAYIWSGNPGWSQSWFDVDGSRKQGTDFVMSSAFDKDFAQNSAQIYLTTGQKIGFHPYNNNNGNTVPDSIYHTWFKGCLLG